MSGSVNYNQIAETYNQRYDANPLMGVHTSLLDLAGRIGARRILEAGCGTGHWLEVMRAAGPQVFGLDLSPGMLRQARLRSTDYHLICGHATRLPLQEQSFDMIYCVNALHHFGDPRAFIFEAQRLLRKSGALAVIGMDPRLSRDSWYVYDYFSGTLAVDIERFPSWGIILDWMAAAGFEHVDWRIAEVIRRTWVGREVFDDPFLKKHSTSQLVLLSDEAYAEGLRRIDATVSAAEAAGEIVEFRNDLLLGMLVGS